MKYSEWKSLSKEEKKQLSYWQLPIIFRALHFSLAGLLILIFAILILAPDVPPAEPEALVKKPIVVTDWDGSVKQVRQYLRQNLNDYKSYEELEWSKLYRDTVNHQYFVRHRYRASNAFGAKIIQDQLFVMDTLTGSVIEVRNF